MKITLRPLSEQVVVVFGASSGIGRAVAIEANRRGALVVAAARGASALDSLRTSVTAPERLEVVVAEAGDPASVAHVADVAVARFGGIDTWAHVAGVAEHARFADIPVDEFRRVVDVDLMGPVHAAKAALPVLTATAMRRGRGAGGAFVVVSSLIARRSVPLLTSYAAAKHGVDGFLEALRLELHHDGVPVSVTQVLPGTVDTPFFDHARTRLGVRPSGPPPVATPERVADAILDAAEHPRRDVVVGTAARLQLVLQRLSPRLVDAATRSRAMHRSQESPQPKAPSDRDALDHPVDGDDRIRAGISAGRR